MRIEQRFSRDSRDNDNDVEWLWWDFEKFWSFFFESRHLDVAVDVHFEQCVSHIELVA
jgi:hypothetical protein